MKQGMEEGREQGIQQGIQQGKKENTVDIVKKMLKENMPIELIEKITGLSKEEIHKLS